MLTFLKKFFGTKSEKDIKSIQPQVDQILEIYPTLASLSNDQLRAKVDALKQKIQDAIKTEQTQINEIKSRVESDFSMDVDSKEELYKEVDEFEKEITKKIEEVLNEILPEAYAILKDTSRRFSENEELVVIANEFDTKLSKTQKNIEIRGNQAAWKNKWIAAGTEVLWNMVHYDVQLIGGAVLHSGKISEMATGEGKTLVSTLPVFLNALSGRGVHVVTVNNYLAKRDSEWNAPLFQFHGLSVDCIDKHEPNTENRRQAYLADITYGTNNEFGFDYLRDNMAREVSDLVQRKHNFAIVDEVDSVLIDDARTPLIISGPTPTGDKHEFMEFKPRVEKLLAAQKAVVQVFLTDAKRLFAEGNEKEAGIPLLRAYRGLPKNGALIKFLSEPGVKALLQKTENHYMQDQQKEMHKIDVELFFVIDEKHNSVDMTEKGIDLITGTTDDPHFFVIPNVGGEIADLEKRVFTDPKEKILLKESLMRDFSVKSERIHTVNQLLKAYSLFEIDQEYVIQEGQIKIVDEQTGRIMEGRRYSDGLHQALEAKENVKIEAATQTYATITLQNYFRMYNKLAGMTGTAETEANEFWDIYKLDVVVIPTNRAISRKDEQDLVYKTKREKYNAVIEATAKLVAEGRPVLIGTTTVDISELLSRMLKLRNIKHNVLNAKLHQKEADIVAEAGQAGTVTIATNMAGRGTDIKLGAGVKDAGGLAIIGTERHESRRVDRQLRGRAGRQGDPGSSQFFVSLEDDLMRKFGSERIAKIMDRMGLKEGEVITHGMVSKSIERAQKKVEENNFGMRKRLLEYDDVMSAQRKAIYKKRHNALFGDRLSLDIANMLYDVADSIVYNFPHATQYEEFTFELYRVLGIESPVNEAEFSTLNKNVISDKLYNAVMVHYKHKNDRIIQKAYGQVKSVYENHNNTFENILFPLSDGVKEMQMVVSLKEAYETNGQALITAFERNVTLALIDDEWKEHLREMDELRTSVQQAVYEQKDPLIVYKLESFELFKSMLGRLNLQTVESLVKMDIAYEQESIQSTNRAAAIQNHYEKAQLGSGIEDAEILEEEVVKKQPIVVEPKIGRNDTCPCGSGKKYKQCHGK